MTTTKIATCCYCGTRATLVLTGRERHVLACSNCGAPLNNLKMLPTEHPGKRKLVKQAKRDPERRRETTRRRKKKPKKSFGRLFFEEAIDALEDIFD